MMSDATMAKTWLPTRGKKKKSRGRPPSPPIFINLEIQISHLLTPASRFSSALPDPPVEPSCCGLELSSSLLGTD